MNAPSQDDGGATSAVKKLFELAADLPYHLKFVVIAVLVIGGAFKLGLDGKAIAAIVFLVVLGLVVDQVRTREPVDLRPRVGEPVTVGVLSFAIVGTSTEEEALGDGFAEELITRLSRIGALDVRPRHVMLKYKARREATRKIARRLKASYLVRGTLRKHGDECRVDAGVIQTWDGDEWREQWQRPFAELFELQSEVAEGVAEHLVGLFRREGADPLEREEREALRRSPAESVDAHYSYVQGRPDIRRFNRRREQKDFESARQRFLRALEQDPGYLDARAELGFLYLLQWETDGAPKWLEQSAAEFRRIREREPDHPVAAAELGYIAFVNGRPEEGFELARAAAERHRGHTITQNVLALLYMYLGFYESAIDLTRNLVTRVDPEYVYPPTNASTCCYLMGDCEGALRWAERAEEVDPSAFIVPLVEGAAWFCKGERRAADRAWRRGLRVAPPYIDPLFEVTRAWIHADRGDLSAARAAVRDHRGDRWLHGAYDPYFISLCALAGEHDLAMDLIRRQVTWASSYRYLVGDPTLRPLRDHPGFAELLRARHARWTELVGGIQDLPAPPPSLPTPDEFLDASE
ncbi:MAG: tetratricopeptide repeat protein [Gemmatimonadetes bacterium]|nr:tetratricopeptide repeat protein [Gemmatimonadota bacterium]NIR81366.1 tetratricopeptide repeat protein [Gemmatimonadota bacterium]NIT88045.1 tetratricopeptide repeat protein [Gemmatimonadota bacterium]NIU34026.1 tetratricopeptide repeat protein [Gemmatimonadota bacterium]NIU36488.1 tetratricopeptide repeat protein [Gemmatimonadota bacterium]